MPRDLAIAAAIIAALAALCATVPRAVRRSLLEGLRCMGRHPDLWRIPALFAVGHAIFQLLAGVLFHWRIEDLDAWIPAFEWNAPPKTASLLLGNALPAADNTASIFTIFTATFPLSALFAFLLLVNRQGLLVEMISALRRRLGRWRGIFLAVTLLLTALCAIAKPAAFLLLPEIEDHVPSAVPFAMDFLSTVFELLLGIFFLTHLMLMAYAWRRGLFFERSKLLHVAMRRAGFVLKWSLLLAALSSVLILLPLHVGILFAPDEDFEKACIWFSGWIGRPAVTLVALFYFPVQAILVFHNESLQQALRDSRRLLRSQWLSLLPFLIACCALFLLLSSASDFLVSRLGPDTSAALGAGIFTAWFESLLAGWFIASWVCLYKSLSAGRKEIPF
ncbi:MAG: hypothetical protein ACREKL_06365 [Chthoniobacterales bacterium]